MSSYSTTTKFRTGTPSAISCVHVADGQIYAGSAHGEIFIWDHQFGTEEPKQLIQLEDTPIRCIFAERGVIHIGIKTQVRYIDQKTETVLCVCERPADGCVRVWKDGEWKGSYRGHTATVLCLTIVGKEMFTGSKDQTIMTWNLKEAKPHVIWRGKFAHNGPIRALAVHRGTLFFADGNRILAQNIATGQRVFKMEGHDTPVKRMVLSKNDGLIYSVCDDRTIRVWDTNTGTQTASITGHSGAINALFVDERGFLFSGSSDQSIREWATAAMIDADYNNKSLNVGLSRQSSFSDASDGLPTLSRDSTFVEPSKPQKAAPKRTTTPQVVAASKPSQNGRTEYGSMKAVQANAAPATAAAAAATRSSTTTNRTTSTRATSSSSNSRDDSLVPLVDDDESGGIGGGGAEVANKDDWANIDELLDFDFDV